MGVQSPLKAIAQVIGLQAALDARPPQTVSPVAPPNPATGLLWIVSPALTIAGTLTAATGVGKVTLSGPTASGVAIGKWQYRIDAGAWVDIASTASPMPATDVTLAAGPHIADVRALDTFGNPTAVLSAPAYSATFINDFGAGQALDTNNLVTYVAGNGTAVVGGNRLTTTSAAATDASGGILVASLSKTAARIPSIKASVSSLADASWLNLIGIRIGAIRPGAIVSAADDCKIICGMFRSGAAYAIRIMYMNAAGVWQLYNYGGVNAGTYQTTNNDYVAATATTYTSSFEIDPNAGSPRWRIGVYSAAGAAILLTPWVLFSAVQGDATNTYWADMGDRFTDLYAGTLSIEKVLI